MAPLGARQPGPSVMPDGPSCGAVGGHVDGEPLAGFPLITRSGWTAGPED